MRSPIPFFTGSDIVDYAKVRWFRLRWFDFKNTLTLRSSLQHWFRFSVLFCIALLEVQFLMLILQIYAFKLLEHRSTRSTSPWGARLAARQHAIWLVGISDYVTLERWMLNVERSNNRGGIPGHFRLKHPCRPAFTAKIRVWQYFTVIESCHKTK